MKILLLGAGGREHTLAWKLAQSPKLEHLFIAPGNAGTAQVGTNIPISVSDFAEIKKFVIENEIKMLVVGPEDPLVNGIADFFEADPLLKDIIVVGPNKAGARLEGSKEYSKEFMQKYSIPTAAYQSFSSKQAEEAIQFLDKLSSPYVIKADGLAAGKGVSICDTKDEASQEIRLMLENKKFGEASSRIVIEEFLKGIELSVFVLTDGQSYTLLPSAKDYKRIGEGDTGLNTGGMGSISSVPFADKEFMQKVKDRIIVPTIQGLRQEGITYKGFVFFGLMNVEGDPYVIEYNVRMGDPETESVIPRVKSDLLEVFEKMADGKLSDIELKVDERFAASVMLVSGGYPEAYEKGKLISNLDKLKDSLIFHAGTSVDIETEKIRTNGGRVLAITSFGDSIPEALQKSYMNAELVQFEGKYFRKDLGNDLLD
ncbi:MAG: phosphoribosylamine--glycine ligase [Bacteroidales bacterium]